MRFYFVILIIISFLTINAQNKTSRLTIEKGGSVYFHFNSLKKIETGIVYSDWTTLSVYFNDVTGGGLLNPTSKWALDVKANTPTIVGDNGVGQFLNLNVIELEASGVGADVTYTGKRTLTNADDKLAGGIVTEDLDASTSPDTRSINITYYCGENIPLIGESTGYYVVDIIFTLRPD